MRYKGSNSSIFYSGCIIVAGCIPVIYSSASDGRPPAAVGVLMVLVELVMLLMLPMLSLSSSSSLESEL